ncbi:MAG: hypothetical protein ABJN42_10755, partial [Roseibium sp.]
MTLPQALVDFSAACQGRFGAGTAGHNDDGAFVSIGERVVHINLDRNANRAVVWTELDRPDHAGFADLEKAAMAYSSRELVARGFVVGVNRAADLILLGRSIEQTALGNEAGLALVSDVATEAEVAAAMIAKTAAAQSN